MKNIFENISEEELDSIALRKATEEYIDDYRDYAEGFKAGYRKAKEYGSDIISEWKEEINEEELDSIALRKATEEYIDDYRDYAEGFKVGYRKASEK